MYFLTTKKLGKNPIIYPKKMIESDFKAAICIAPTVIQALIAISALNHIRYFKNGKVCFRKRSSCFNIYETEKKGRRISMLFDSTLTGERRLYHPTRFRFVGTVPEKVVRKVNSLLKVINDQPEIFYYK